jgi:hypothetical protein
MKARLERLDLFEEPIGQFLATHHRKSGNVVDRLLGIEFGALSTGPVEYVDEFRLQIEKPELEDGKQADWPRANNCNVRFDSHSGTAFRAKPRLIGGLRLARQPELRNGRRGSRVIS